MRRFITAVLALGILLAHGPAAPAQYSKEILSRPTANATLGPYVASQLNAARGPSVTVNRWNGFRPGHSHWHGGHFSHGAVIPGYGYPYIPSSPYIATYPYGYVEPWPYYLDTGAGPLGPYVAPPLYVPPEQLGYGPQAVRQFMGLDAVQRQIVNRTVVVAPPAANEQQPNKADAVFDGRNAPDRPRVRESNAEARERAGLFIEIGDRHFRDRKLADAYDRYKKAAEAAPDLSEPYFRQGHALTALTRYDQAAAAFRRGLALRPDWAAGGFRLSELYRDKDAARLATLDTLRRNAEAQPADANLQLAAGVAFFFDGQKEAAQKFFERAQALGEARANVEPFLKALGAADEEMDI
jgi:hypothetical protein